MAWNPSGNIRGPKGDTGGTGPAGANGTNTAPAFSFPGSLSLYTGQIRWTNDTGRTLTITAVRASVGTAPTGAAVIVDVNKNGTSIFTTQGNRPTGAAGANTIKRTNADVVSVADGDYLTVDIDQIGSTVPGADLSVVVTLA